MKGGVSVKLLLLLLLVPHVLLQEEDEEDQEIYLEQNSFREPFYLARSSALPYWEFGGSTIVSDKFVRLTPKDQSRSGWIVNTHPLKVKNWVVKVKFLAGGGGHRGGDGFALWYTKRPISPGPVYGAAETWNGLGIFFDTYDNDQKGDNPSITAMLNKDSLVYSAGDDGIANSLARCVCPFRDRIITATIRYIDGVLELVSDVASRTSPRTCFSVAVELPRGYFLSLSAMTGQLVDQHDIFYLQTFKLKRPKVHQEEEEEGFARNEAELLPKKKSRIPKIEYHEEEAAPVRRKKIKPVQEEHHHQEEEEEEEEEEITPRKKSSSPSKKKKRIPHVHGAEGDGGHFNKVLKGLADFENRFQPDLMGGGGGRRGSDHPNVPNYQKSIPDNIHLLNELFLQIQWLQTEQNQTISELEQTQTMLVTDKKSLQLEHQLFAGHLSKVLKSLATKSDLQDLLTEESDEDSKKFKERMKKLSDDLSSLRSTVRSENLEVTKSLNSFSSTLRSIRASMELISGDQKQLGTSLQDATHELALSINKNTKFGIWGYILIAQALLGVVAVSLQIFKMSSSSLKLPSRI